MTEPRYSVPQPSSHSVRYGMPFSQQILESLENLHLLGRRAILALLGIAVGCAAVVALLNIGRNAENEAMRIFQGMGSEIMVANIQRLMNGKMNPLLPSPNLDISALHKTIPEINAASVLIPASVQVRMNGRTDSATVVGSSAELPSVLGLTLAQGRFLSDFDGYSTYVVLGANVAEQLTQINGHAIQPGTVIQLGDYLYQIVGILASTGPNPIIPLSIDDVILMSDRGMRRVIGLPQIGNVVIRSQNSDGQENISSRLQAWLAEQMPGFDIHVQLPRQLIEGMEQQSRLFSWLLTGLGGISLLVGGVGVMNVMVMNVSERRREIGVRMALGARPRDIATLFLLEALVLASVGALLGAVVGMFSAWLFVYFAGWSDFVFSLTALQLGTGSAIAIGLFFGLSPALSAARLEPVDALRDV